MLSILRSPRAALRRHLATRSRGQSLVEFALILPVFLLFFAAVLDLGRIAAAQIAVSNAAREGVFQAAQTPTDFNSSQPCPADGKTNVIYCRIALESSGGVTIAPTDVSVTCNPVDCSTGIGNTVSVRVTGHFRLFTPLMAVFFGGNQNVTFAGSATANRETLPVTGASTPAPSASPSPSPSASPSSSPSASPSPSPSPSACTLPSAGFTYTTSPANNQAPVTINVVDTSTSISCGITSWLWTWGDGTTTLSKVPGPHTYVVKNPDKSGGYIVSLKVTNAAGSTTSGGQLISVK
jgi:TadE-like protein/PKD domain-containing protein